jgi:hypothetical protein
METADVIRLDLRGSCEIIVMTAVLNRDFQYVQVVPRIEITSKMSLSDFASAIWMPHTNSGSRVPAREPHPAIVGRIPLWSVSRCVRLEAWQISTLPSGNDSRGAGQVRQVTLGVAVLAAVSFPSKR